VARWQFSGEDLVAVVGCDFGSFLQHEGETRLVRRCTKGRNGGLGPMLFFAVVVDRCSLRQWWQQRQQLEVGRCRAVSGDDSWTRSKGRE
jgi:hypothetical protein